MKRVCVCVSERERQKHPLIHSVTQFPWWFELYLTMWRTFSASIFAVSLLHLFQCGELKVWMVSAEEMRDKMTFGPESGSGQFRGDVLMSVDRLGSNGYKHVSKGWRGQSSFLQGCVEGCGKLPSSSCVLCLQLLHYQRQGISAQAGCCCSTYRNIMWAYFFFY